MKLHETVRVLEAYSRESGQYAPDAKVTLVNFDLSALRAVVGPHYGVDRPNPPWLDHDPYYLLVYDADPSWLSKLAPHLAQGSSLDFDSYDYFLTSYGDGTALEVES